MPLEIACIANIDPKLIRHLLQKGAMGKGNTVLCLAAKAGYIEILRILLSEEGGMDVTAESDPSKKSCTHEYGGNTLYWAAAFGKADTVESLLSRGARKDIRNGVGILPKGAAVSFKNHECTALLGGDPEPSEWPHVPMQSLN